MIENVFVERNELSHAALLAWLLDPRASHGMGSTPLRRFLIASARRARLALEIMGDLPGIEKAMQKAVRRRLAA